MVSTEGRTLKAVVEHVVNEQQSDRIREGVEVAH